MCLRLLLRRFKFKPLEHAHAKSRRIMSASTADLEAPASIPIDSTVSLDDSSLNVILYGLQPVLDTKKFCKILTEFGVETQKVTKVFRQSVAKIRFSSLEQKGRSLDIIRSTNLGGAASQNQKIGIKTPQPQIGPPASKKAKITDDSPESASTTQRSIADVINPWHGISYQEQLTRKRNEMMEYLRQIVSRTAKENSYAPFPRWLERARSADKADRVACPLEEIIPSPHTEGYRNKIELSAGRDHLGRPCFGFLLGAAADGLVAVSTPDQDCKIISQAQREFISQVLNPLLLDAVESQALLPWDKASHTGFFRVAMLRVNTQSEALLMLQVNPNAVDQSNLESIVDRLAKNVIEKSQRLTSGLKLTSLFVQYHSGVSNAAPADAPLQLRWGSPYLEESMLGLKFQLSPLAFFQVNTPAAELLYAKVRAMAVDHLAPEAKTTVFDVCCGTGTIGLCVAAGLPSLDIVGVDIVKEAIDDAAANAVRNNIPNARFLAGKAEDVFPSLLKTSSQGLKGTSGDRPQFVAIVDPPRAGLHARVIKAIRDFEFIESLIYVSCNQKSLINDAVGLCRAQSGSMPGREFEPIRAVAVDLFPHTPHCELIVEFRRRKSE